MSITQTIKMHLHALGMLEDKGACTMVNPNPATFIFRFKKNKIYVAPVEKPRHIMFCPATPLQVESYLIQQKVMGYRVNVIDPSGLCQDTMRIYAFEHLNQLKWI